MNSMRARVFTAVVTIVACLALAALEARASVPQCRWACDDPVCSAECQAVCAAPNCTYECEPALPAPTCRAPKCRMLCPSAANSSVSESCPVCDTVCPPLVCSPAAATATCQILCAAPDCHWYCAKPAVPAHCLAPRCTLQCEQPACAGPAPLKAGTRTTGTGSYSTLLLFLLHVFLRLL